MGGVVYIASKKLKDLVDRYGLEKVMKCRTVAQLIKMHEIGLVPSNVAEQARNYFEKECADIGKAIFETFD